VFLIYPSFLQVQDLRSKLLDFMERHVLPAEETFEVHATGPDRWSVHPRMEQLKNMVIISTLRIYP
jgi:hypothetical protein